MSVSILRSLFTGLVLTGTLCLCPTAHAAPTPVGGNTEDLTAAVPPLSEGAQTVRILVSSLVALLPAIQPRSFETGPVEHPWVMWLPESGIDSSWYRLRGVDHALAVSPYILNGSARSAASAGLVFGLSY